MKEIGNIQPVIFKHITYGSRYKRGEYFDSRSDGSLGHSIGEFAETRDAALKIAIESQRPFLEFNDDLYEKVKARKLAGSLREKAQVLLAENHSPSRSFDLPAEMANLFRHPPYGARSFGAPMSTFARLNVSPASIVTNGVEESAMVIEYICRPKVPLYDIEYAYQLQILGNKPAIYCEAEFIFGEIATTLRGKPIINERTSTLSDVEIFNKLMVSVSNT